MDEKIEAVKNAILTAIKYHTEHLKDFNDYAPVFNSLNMLKQLEANLQSNNYKSALLNNLNEVNVGLLAAKFLDSEEKNSILYAYATTLHQVWIKVLNLLQISTFAPAPHQIWKAYNFYKKHKYDHSRIINHLSCIDFTCPIQIESLTTSLKVSQWKIPSLHQGDYYCELRNCITPSCLGIHDYQQDKSGSIHRRIKHTYELQKNILVLQSFARGVLDTWSVKSRSIQTLGGCIQYFNSNDKTDFKQIGP